MTPYYADDWLTVYHGDALAVLSELPAESVHCVVTSPPYWGLRDYGTASWGGGDADCDHSTPRSRGDDIRQGDKQGTSAGSRPNTQRVCPCGAVREDGQLGLEATPEAYVAAMVAVFREVRRVLRKDGTVWLNLGDSYATRPQGHSEEWIERTGGNMGLNARNPTTHHTTLVPDGLKPKDLVGIPWRVAFALQADGWYLRSDIIWAKPNPMPESVTDRPTKAHEYVFLLSRSPRYYFDADAVREASTERPSGNSERFVAAGGERSRLNTHLGSSVPYQPDGSGRNLRSVWTIATQPYPGAHFAVFPEALVEPCVKAGTSERGVCPECGAPWQRIVERVTSWAARKAAGGTAGNVGVSETYQNGVHGKGVSHDLDALSVTTTGWRPSCGHDGEPVPATVLDMFAGSGTVGLVAQRLSRRAVLIDLSMDYLDQLMDRNRQTPLGLGA